MKRSLKILLTISALSIFTVSFLPTILNGTPASPAVGNWFQQFMPNLGSQQINDIIFLDSIKGFAIASRNVNPDTSSILRTTNGGDTWQIVQTLAPRRFSRIKFVNNATGFISGGSGSGTPYLYKTIDGGNTWNTVPGATLGNALWGDMAVISEDTIWLTDANSLNGGVYRTTNGGASWDQQLNLGSQNPEKIYMYNQRIGYISRNQGSSGYVRKTTDGGNTWSLIVNNDYYLNIRFADSLTGWKNSAFGMKKTTDGGLNWNLQTIPNGGIIQNGFIFNFTLLSKDTLWGTGGYVLYPNNQTRGILYRTIDGGANWQFQVPDTSINMSYSYICFTNRFNGWVYSNGPTGIHTTTGGDPIWITGIEQISSEIPREFMLFQNFPNPFNPVTNIKYQITNNNSFVQLIVYDITGKEIIKLVDREQTAGTYNVDFAGNFISSGIYFYRIEAEETNGAKFTDSKKMVLLK